MTQSGSQRWGAGQDLKQQWGWEHGWTWSGRWSVQGQMLSLPLPPPPPSFMTGIFLVLS